MRIATWNLNHPPLTPTNARRAEMLRWMSEIKADIWVLTETLDDLSPGEGYKCIARSEPAADLETYKNACWTAIWSRIGGTSSALKEERDRAACALVPTNAGTSLLVYGTVLPWFSDRRWPEVTGVAAFEKALSLQAAEWDRLKREHAGAHLCVAGDFNQSLPYFSRFGTHEGGAALDRALAAHNLACPTGSIDPLLAATGRPTIDHICISRPLIAARNVAVGVWPQPPALDKALTDHYGIWLDIAV